MKKNKKKKKTLWKKFLTIFFAIFLIFSTVYVTYAISLYKSIETLLRILGCITLSVFSLLLFTLLNKFKKFSKATLFIIFSIISLLYCGSLTFVGNKVNNIYKKISTISSNNYDNYSTSIITRKNYGANDINDIKNGKIGIINDEDDYEGYTIGNKILKDNNLNNTVKYDGYIEMVTDLLNNKIDFAIVPTHYDSMLSSGEGFEDISQTTKIIYTKEEKKEKKMSTKSTKSLDEPFTVLIMGVDTVNDGFSSGFNGDALILVTFNPKTTNATILSIPRDTYMPISCMKDRKNKITNAGWRGESCIINSLENYFGIEIDYHVKINFNGVVDLVNALGGVEVDVPYSFCEQNSKRKWGKNTVFVKSGKQTLNGEKALAFARHRKITQYMINYCGPEYTSNGFYWNDFTRGQNQQIIINALLKKLKNIDSFSAVESILDTISKNIETDISTNNILSLYNLGKDSLKKSANKDEAFQMQKLYLLGHDASIYDYSFATNSGTKLVLYNYSVFEESKEAVIKAMKENLGLIEVTPVKTFTFSIKNKFEEKIIGKNITTRTSKLTLMPNFIGSDVGVANTFANNNNIHLNINYVDGTKGQVIGQIVSQSIPAKTDLDMLSSSRTLTVDVVQSVSNKEPEIIDNSEDDPYKNPFENNDSNQNTSDNSTDNSNENQDNTTPSSNDNGNETTTPSVENTDNNQQTEEPKDTNQAQENKDSSQETTE